MSTAPVSQQGSLDRLDAAAAYASVAFDAAEEGRLGAMTYAFEKARCEVAFLFKALEDEAVVIGNQQFLKNLVILHDVLGIASGSADFEAVLTLRKVHDSRLNLAKFDLRLCEIHPLPRRPLRKAPRPAA